MNRYISTILYLLIFLLSFIFVYLAQFQFYKNDKTGKHIYFYNAILLSVIALAFPIILAGLRGDYVGTDVTVYGLKSFELVSACSNIEEVWKISNGEFLFFFVGYIVSKLNLGIKFFFGIIQFLTICPIYIGIYKFRKTYRMWMSMVGYLFLFYNLTLNAMRQSICIAFVFLAFCYFLENKYKIFGLLCVIAFFFHNSAAIGILALILFWYANKDITSILKKYFLIIGIIISIFILNKIGSMLFSLGILKINYLSYITKLESGQLITLQMKKISESAMFYLFTHFIFWLLPFSVSLISRKKNNRDSYFNFIIGISCLLYTLVLFAFNSIYAYRITIFFDIFLIFSFPNIKNILVKNKSTNIISNVLIVTMYFIYWYVIYILCNWHGTSVYSFR